MSVFMRDYYNHALSDDVLDTDKLYQTIMPKHIENEDIIDTCLGIIGEIVPIASKTFINSNDEEGKHGILSLEIEATESTVKISKLLSAHSFNPTDNTLFIHLKRTPESNTVVNIDEKYVNMHLTAVLSKSKTDGAYLTYVRRGENWYELSGIGQYKTVSDNNFRENTSRACAVLYASRTASQSGSAAMTNIKGGNTPKKSFLASLIQMFVGVSGGLEVDLMGYPYGSSGPVKQRLETLKNTGRPDRYMADKTAGMRNQCFWISISDWYRVTKNKEMTVTELREVYQKVIDHRRKWKQNCKLNDTNEFFDLCIDQCNALAKELGVLIRVFLHRQGTDGVYVSDRKLIKRQKRIGDYGDPNATVDDTIYICLFGVDHSMRRIGYHFELISKLKTDDIDYTIKNHSDQRVNVLGNTKRYKYDKDSNLEEINLEEINMILDVALKAGEADFVEDVLRHSRGGGGNDDEMISSQFDLEIISLALEMENGSPGKAWWGAFQAYRVAREKHKTAYQDVTEINKEITDLVRDHEQKVEKKQSKQIELGEHKHLVDTRTERARLASTAANGTNQTFDDILTSYTTFKHGIEAIDAQNMAITDMYKILKTRKDDIQNAINQAMKDFYDRKSWKESTAQFDTKGEHVMDYFSWLTKEDEKLISEIPDQIVGAASNILGKLITDRTKIIKESLKLRLTHMLTWRTGINMPTSYEVAKRDVLWHDILDIGNKVKLKTPAVKDIANSKTDHESLTKHLKICVYMWWRDCVKEYDIKFSVFQSTLLSQGNNVENFWVTLALYGSFQEVVLIKTRAFDVYMTINEMQYRYKNTYSLPHGITCKKMKTIVDNIEEKNCLPFGNDTHSEDFLGLGDFLKGSSGVDAYHNDTVQKYQTEHALYTTMQTEPKDSESKQKPKKNPHFADPNKDQSWMKQLTAWIEKKGSELLQWITPFVTSFAKVFGNVAAKILYQTFTMLPDYTLDLLRTEAIWVTVMMTGSIGVMMTESVVRGVMMTKSVMKGMEFGGMIFGFLGSGYGQFGIASILALGYILATYAKGHSSGTYYNYTEELEKLKQLSDNGYLQERAICRVIHDAMTTGAKNKLNTNITKIKAIRSSDSRDELLKVLFNVENIPSTLWNNKHTTTKAKQSRTLTNANTNESINIETHHNDFIDFYNTYLRLVHPNIRKYGRMSPQQCHNRADANAYFKAYFWDRFFNMYGATTAGGKIITTPFHPHMYPELKSVERRHAILLDSNKMDLSEINADDSNYDTKIAEWRDAVFLYCAKILGSDNGKSFVEFFSDELIDGAHPTIYTQKYLTENERGPISAKWWDRTVGKFSKSRFGDRYKKIAYMHYRYVEIPKHVRMVDEVTNTPLDATLLQNSSVTLDVNALESIPKSTELVDRFRLARFIIKRINKPGFVVLCPCKHDPKSGNDNANHMSCSSMNAFQLACKQESTIYTDMKLLYKYKDATSRRIIVNEFLYYAKESDLSYVLDELTKMVDFVVKKTDIVKTFTTPNTPYIEYGQIILQKNLDNTKDFDKLCSETEKNISDRLTASNMQ
jgi:hypothetical protein